MSEKKTTPYEHLVRFLHGAPVHVSEGFVRMALSRYPVRSASRRGYVIAIDDWLVRLADDPTGAWTVQKLPQDARVAGQLGHEHVLGCVTLPDGTDVLECRGCGSEW